MQKRISNKYKVNDKVLLTRPKRTKHGEKEYDGPYSVLAVHANGSVKMQKPNYSDIVHMRRLIPDNEYKDVVVNLKSGCSNEPSFSLSPENMEQHAITQNWCNNPK